MGAWIRSIENDLRIVFGQARSCAKSFDVGELNVSLSDHGNLLSGSVDPAVVECLHIVNRREVVGGQVSVAADAGCKIRAQRGPNTPPVPNRSRLQAEII